MLEQFFQYLPESTYVAALLILIFSFILAEVVSYLFKNFLPKITSRTKTDFDDKLAAMLRKPVFYTIILAGIYTCIKYLGLGLSIATIVDNAVLTILVIIVSFTAAKIVKLFIENYGKKIADRTESDLDNHLLPLLENLSELFIYFVGIMLILRIWNIDITPLLASAGIAGFAIAFAAKDTIANFFGGISIFFDKPFRIGDRIQLESGEQGHVLKIGVRTTRIKTFDNTELSIPNSVIANSRVINWNAPEARTKVKITVSVAYGSDVDKVKEIILDEAKKCKDVLDEPEPNVYFKEMGESSLNFLLVCWAPSPSTFSIKDKLNTAIYKRLAKEGIEIPFPTRTIYIKK
ncbi:MAG: mechanosensitive ion channel family protein [Candidatus Aenigmatarchaeota archaeon]|nr:MAG: mechanosensitive ion channel family protein [Candidatus Aenigmarchaeota archaeon]